MTVLTDKEQIDCFMNAINNVASAKNFLLSGNANEAMRKLDSALTWCRPLLGIEHPMESVKAHVLQPPLLRHEDSLHQGRWI